jgi:hypothetical protein
MNKLPPLETILPVMKSTFNLQGVTTGRWDASKLAPACRSNTVTVATVQPVFQRNGDVDHKPVNYTVHVVSAEYLEFLCKEVITNGRCLAEDCGCAESGPSYSYDGHKWGQLLCLANERTCVWRGELVCYTSREHLSTILSEISNYTRII